MRPLAELVADRPFPLPRGGKEDRGVLVIVGGPPACPGGALLAATAALRTGSGRVQLVVHPHVAPSVAVAMPEALVLSWDLLAAPPPDVVQRLEGASAVVLGPGLSDAPPAAAEHVAACAQNVPLLLDAGALGALERLRWHPALVVCPNPREAATALEVDPDVPVDQLATILADRLGRAALVRGAITVLAEPDGSRWFEEGVDVLGTPGSGDVLVGVVGGLLARGVDLRDALAWAALAHARAGRLLTAGRPLGWLAREIADALPEALAAPG